MLTIERTSQFKRDFKRMLRQGVDAKHRDHALKGEWLGFRECHITPDWLLVYKIINDELILTLARTGNHSDLFG